MKVHVYSIVWNEEILLPYFLRHYSLFADRIFIINDHSTDKTVEIAKSNNKVTLLDYKYDRKFNDEDHCDCFTNCYKKYSRGEADWVICVDGDELIYNKNMISNLENQRNKGIKIIKTRGYAMLSEKIPTCQGQIYEESFLGMRERRYDKPTVFNPNLDIVFGPGRHYIKSPSDIVPQSGRLMLLHYRYLSRAYYIKRSVNELARMEISDKLRRYLIKGGLKFYDTAIESDLQKII